MFHHIICDEEFGKRINANYINYHYFYGYLTTPVSPSFLDFLKTQLDNNILADVVQASSTLIGLLTSISIKSMLYCDTLAILTAYSLLSMQQTTPIFHKIHNGFNYKKRHNGHIYEYHYDQKNLVYNDLLHSILLYKIALGNTDSDYLKKIEFLDRLKIFFKIYEMFSLLFPYKIFYNIHPIVILCQYEYNMSLNGNLAYDIPSKFSFLIGTYNISNNKDTKEKAKDEILNEIKYRAAKFNNVQDYFTKIYDNIEKIKSLYKSNYSSKYKDFFPKEIQVKILFDKININIDNLVDLENKINKYQHKNFVLTYKTTLEKTWAKFFKDNISQEIYSYFVNQNFNGMIIDSILSDAFGQNPNEDKKYFFASAHLGNFGHGYLPKRFKRYFYVAIKRYQNLIKSFIDKDLKNIESTSLYDLLLEQNYDLI